MDQDQPAEREPPQPPKDGLRKVHPEEESRGQQVDPDRSNDRDD